MAEKTRREFISKTVLASLGGGAIALLFGSGGGGIGSETDPRAVLLNPPSSQTIIQGNPLTIRDLGAAGLGSLRLASLNDDHQILFLSNANDHLQIRMKIDQILAPTAISSFLSFSLVDDSYKAGLVTFDVFNLLGFGTHTLIIGDDGSLLPNTVSQIVFFTDPTVGSLNFGRVGAGGLQPSSSGAQVGLPTGTAGANASTICTGNHRHAFSGRFFFCGFISDAALGGALPVIWQRSVLGKAITLNRITVDSLTPSTGVGNDVIRCGDGTNFLTVNLPAGGATATATGPVNIAALQTLRIDVNGQNTVPAKLINVAVDYSMNV